MSGVEGLKPCPFCGGEAWLNDYEAKYSDLPPQSRAPQCRSCGVSPGYLATSAKAIAAWNRRAALSAIEGRGGALQPSASVPTEREVRP
jgi:Lar family restriction alleviation protein